MNRVFVSYILGVLTIPLVFGVYLSSGLPFFSVMGRTFEVPLKNKAYIEIEIVDRVGFMSYAPRVALLKHRDGRTLVDATINHYCFDQIGIEGLVGDPDEPDGRSNRYFNYIFRDQDATVVPIASLPDEQVTFDLDLAHRPCGSDPSCMARLESHQDLFKDNWRAQFGCPSPT